MPRKVETTELLIAVPEPIEQQISSALSSNNNSAQVLAELLAATTNAITQADQVAATERSKALDPARSPNPQAARQAMEDASFVAERLQTLLPRLQQRYDQVAQAEQYAAWAASFDAIKPKHVAAAEKFKQVFVAFQDKLVDALTEAKAIDQEVKRIAHAKPHHLPQANNDGRSLPTVEAAARGLPSVNPDFSFMQMKLPAFDKPNQFAWPPYEIPFAVRYATSMIPAAGDPRQFTGEWWKVQQERAAAARQQQQHEQHERQEAIDRANPGAVRWWENKTA
jgi:hypothetical protein